jgi:hypothetical protein
MRRNGRLYLAICGALAFLALAAAPSFAYDEVGSGGDCIDCHGVASPTDIRGPHGGYTTTTNKCRACHTVHAANPSGVMLLPAATIKGTCETCHDGSGGQGVYGAIGAQFLAVEADHSIDTTSMVPGGDASTGGSKSYSFGGENGYMTCSDCHSPHGAAVVNAFTGDRTRSDTSTISYVSNRLLRKRPNGATYDIDEYGSDWCGACHRGRLTFGSGVNNHPVESTATTDFYYYDVVARVDGFASSNTETGTMGRTNRGYVMPFPRTSDQTDHYPICQQCHEDARNVGDTTFGQLAAGEAFTVTTADGTTAGDNPRFQTFPHESTNPNFLVETDDDLCTNCHDPDVPAP